MFISYGRQYTKKLVLILFYILFYEDGGWGSLFLRISFLFLPGAYYGIDRDPQYVTVSV